MRLLLWACVALLAALPATSALPQDRIGREALVIGNASYPEATAPLSNTIRDVRTITDELRRRGFAVDLRENLGKTDMQRAIRAFLGRIDSGSAALFYFSGYGIQSGRQTYLIPVDAQIWTEPDIRRDGFSIDALLAEMHRRGAKVKIIVLDAARRNPFEGRFRRSGLGLAPIEAGDGTLAMYSGAPGKELNEGSGSQNLFVSELVKELRTADRTAEDMFNRTRVAVSRASHGEQVPWVASTLAEDFYFSTAPRVSPPTTAQTEGPTTASPPLTRTSRRRSGDVFRDCGNCPELVVVPAGAFDMGSNFEHENPVHRVNIAKTFAIGRYEVTFDEWDMCVEEEGCRLRPDDRNWGRGKRPVINVSWVDSNAFVGWLARKTGFTYRLPSEAEWEYAARAGTSTAYWWGRDIGAGQANCRECGSAEAQKTSPVGSYRPNPFGLYDTAGNTGEWVQDCWNDSYRGAPNDGGPWGTGECRLRVMRGGAFDGQARDLRSAARSRHEQEARLATSGLRIVRELP